MPQIVANRFRRVAVRLVISKSTVLECILTPLRDLAYIEAAAPH
jgi:hypothetical protein